MHTELLPGIDWVGFVDWNIRDFHSYNTERGATYNSYLIRDQKVALVDGVKKAVAGTLLKNVNELVDLEKVDYIICNHAEQDHAGAMPALVAAMPQAEIVCTAKCKEILSGYTDTTGWKFRLVANGETLSLGENTLTFIHTPMVHWPDSMFTYVAEKKLLFSMDGFGQHIASSERFDDELPLDTLMEEAKIYYANIVYPYGAQVQKVLKAAAGLDIQMIAPSHGVIWRKNLPAILAAYEKWSTKTADKKVVIFYDSMWESTEIMAQAIYEGVLSVPGVTCQMLHVRKSTLTEISTAAMDAKCCALGSSTLNGLPLPQMAAVMNYLHGLRFPIQHAVAFGSLGWGKNAVDEISAWFEKVSWTPAADAIKCKWRPTPEVLALCVEAGKTLALKASE